MDRELLFKETQRYRQPQLWLLMAVVGINVIAFIVYAMMKQLAFDEPLGGGPINPFLLVGAGSLLVVAVLGFILLMLFAQLVTEIWTDGITLRFFPIQVVTTENGAPIVTGLRIDGKPYLEAVEEYRASTKK